ncbi:MAG: phenylalanine--tRNA ligase subunit alpha [Candidatus Parvarchaeota archaeon]|nr:phenylalanine--tRNA ligase subunit alpha [Candidatus Jingweiarchaeum tengchongense]MCW1297725.1 phenylalanine--tRNA ligase subunit alpha [Candidatus Jingweiarchaeum tengchongense]MCW1299735.1 phenylalanine--tRNA ligase subunit alpha [Candidatus Jingweiarchaeum tengchongense]MCW1304294.1 phenylalanine--tRNA ligase subunit alpha [Candidatus Jingweiarchaeum tengchongense]MCW1305321.1 phenylalanine--tRNA ligase subunit alpha [Candidatus Jingweiarchaeum tengchongense]
MDVSEVAEKLHRFERRFLKAIEKYGEGKEISEISRLANLKEVEGMRAVQWLRSKGLIILKERPREKIRLTPLGEKYLEEGLPEERFLNVIASETKSFNQIIEQAKLTKDEFDVSIGILKKRNLIDVVDNKVKITHLGIEAMKRKNKERMLLETLKDGEKGIDEIGELKNVIGEMIKRGLVKSELMVEKRIFVTDIGKKVTAEIKEEMFIDQLTPSLIKKGEWKNVKFRKYDILAPVPEIFAGKKQVYLNFLDQVKQRLVALGFQEVNGPVIEMMFFNCDALFMPQDHPAREIHDIYFIKEPRYGTLFKYKKFFENVVRAHEKGFGGSKGWGYKFNEIESKRLILRSHGTAVSARTMMSKELKIPGRYFTIARVYRPDVVDWKHLTEFNQLEGIALDESITFRNLLGILKEFAISIAKCNEMKFVPSYYPFTEPSVDLYLKFGDKWIEAGGAGIFRPEVTMPLGINVPVIAWGIGIDRLFMLREGINDIRNLFSRDLGWLRKKDLKCL